MCHFCGFSIWTYFCNTNVLGAQPLFLLKTIWLSSIYSFALLIITIFMGFFRQKVILLIFPLWYAYYLVQDIKTAKLYWGLNSRFYFPFKLNTWAWLILFGTVLLGIIVFLIEYLHAKKVNKYSS